MHNVRHRLAVRMLAILILCSPAAFASRPFTIDADVVGELAHPSAGKTIVVGPIPLVDGAPTSLEVWRLDVWRPDAKIVVYDNKGNERILPAPHNRLFGGRVLGLPDSAVFLSLTSDNAIRGIVIAGERAFRIDRGIRRESLERGVRRAIDHGPLLVREFDTTDEALLGVKRFKCATESIAIENVRDVDPAGNPRVPRTNANGGPNATYSLNLAIETDTELFAAFGSTTALTDYLSYLVGAASVIYQRDLKTTLTIGTVHVWAGGTDPWTIGPDGDLPSALGELGTYWHNNYGSVARSTVVMVSGKGFNGGVAWTNVLCGGDFLCQNGNCGDSSLDGQYGGAYAFCGSLSSGVTTNVPDPTLTVNGIQYGLPNTTDYWMLLGFAHELGHNANGPHTHCIQLSAADKSHYGVTRNYVDECFSGECFVGSTTVPAEKGTIMSFCQNIVVSGVRQSRYLFWKANEPSELIATYFTTGLEQGTPNAAITVGSNLACSSGQTASVPNVAGNAYSWTIIDGSITGGATTNVITFTPTGRTVTVGVTITNPQGCSITTSATATTQCTPPATPTGVVATATSTTSVSISWNAATGASNYDVARCTTISTCTVVGNPTATSFNDTTASPSTAYLYKVRSRDSGGNLSPYSTPDLATTVIFTDPAIAIAATAIKAVHFAELRTAVNAVRTLAGLSAASFTDPVLDSSVTVKALHLTELRTALDHARSTLSLTPLSYTPSTITPTITIIKALNISQLRAGVQ